MKELLLIGFILTSAVESQSSEEALALRNAARAFYKQSNAEATVNAYVKREVPKGLQTISGNAFWLAKTLQERKLIVTWSF